MIALLLAAWLAPFALTVLAKCPVYALSMTACAIPPSGHCLALRRVFLAALAPFITHPLVWFAVLAITSRGHSYISTSLGGVLFTLVVEALYLNHVGVEQAVRWSLLGNGIALVLVLALQSWLVG